MSIRYVEGNICDAYEDIIAHGCNAQGKMNSGVARALRDRWPQIFAPYEQFCETRLSTGDLGRCSLGEAIPVAVSDPDKIILNLITQQFYGRDGLRYVSYDAIDNGLRGYLKYRAAHGPTVKAIALPAIGAGLGGGRWRIISAILHDISEGWEVDFTVYCPTRKERWQWEALDGLFKD